MIEGQVAYTFPSDGRFKFNVSEADVKGLDFITKLRPVVYNFDAARFQQFLAKNMPEADQRLYMNADFGPATAVRQSGFIAQEVEQAAKESGYNFNGVLAPANADDHYSVAYSQFVVPLVKAVQEQQAMITAQQRQIDELQKMVATLSNTDHAKLGAINSDVQVFPNPSSVLDHQA
ncbi:MAG: tail fiber domain-containing protein [Bacteroidia bacterium]